MMYWAYMKPIFFAILRGRNPSYPAVIAIRRGDDTYRQSLYHSDNLKPLNLIKQDLYKIRLLFIKAVESGIPIHTNDRTSLIESMDFRQHRASDKIFDHGQVIYDKQALETYLSSLDQFESETYRKLLFDAGCVYDKLTETPIYVNYSPMQSNWSLDTFTGRSKCTGFNIQGYNYNDFITRDGYFEDKILIHFDWICADLRIASIVSGDGELESAFRHGDPYEYLYNRSNGLYADRKESKIALLKAINSLNFDSDIFNICYADLRTWLIECAHKLTENLPLETIMGRKFIIPEDKTILSGINGVLQGSIAHAMQHTITRVFDIFPRHIICDIHDSLVMSCENDRSSISHMINRVQQIMSKPFDGLIDRDIYFPLRFGIGKRWREYKYSAIQREKDEQEIPEDTSEGQGKVTLESQA